MTSQQPGTWKWVITVPCSCWCHTTDSAVPLADAPGSGGKLHTHGDDPEPVSGSLSHAETA